MEKTITKSSFGSLKILLPVSIFLSVVIAGGREPYHEVSANLATKSSVDSIRAKNTLTLQRIEEKFKSYELTNKH